MKTEGVGEKMKKRGKGKKDKRLKNDFYFKVNFTV